MKRVRTALGGAPGEVRNVKDWILWGALGCVLVSTAHAEYTLATATGVHWFVAGAVPGALDLYVIRALQVRRDVFLSVLAMVGANVASHLVAAGELAVGWQLVSAVGALPPLILWRVHSLWYGRVRNRSELLWDAPAGALPLDWDDDYVPSEWQEEFGPRLVRGAADAPEVHPENEMYPDLHLPEGWEREVYPAALAEGDSAYLGALRAYLAECTEQKRKPSCRGCKEFVHVSQDRAKRLMAYAGYPVPAYPPKEES